MRHHIADQHIFSIIRTGEIGSLKTFVNKNPDSLHSKNHQGFTPLIIAAYCDQKEIVKCLLNQDVNIDDRDASGNTALMGVCFNSTLTD